MRATTFCSLTLLSLALPFAALAEPHAKPHVNRHHDLAVRARGDIALKKRTTNARWTYYDVGLSVGLFSMGLTPHSLSFIHV